MLQEKEPPAASAPALFWEPAAEGSVRCTLCPHLCVVREGKKGVCGVRETRGGAMRTLVFGGAVASHIDPIEKKPIFHMSPGSLSFSIATVGCNMKCAFCQNSTISQVSKGNQGLVIREDFAPEDVVRAARRHGCSSISYTYTEPTIFFEYAIETAKLARSAGMRNIFVSNGYIMPDAIAAAAPWLDAVNIDLKSFSEATYKRVMGARLAPVLEAIRAYHAAGIWVEVTTLVVPGMNDSPGELQQIADFIVGIDRTIPWHVSRFHPDFKMTDRPATPIRALRDAAAIGAAAGMQFVYVGNLPDGGGESTLCPGCGTMLIERRGFVVLANAITGGACPSCGLAVPGIDLSHHAASRR